MRKKIIFDYGNVIARFDKDYIVSQSAADESDKALLVSAVFHDWERLDRNETTETDYLSEVKKLLPVRLHPAAEDIMRCWYLRLPPICETLAFLRELKERGYESYLLSNIPLSFVNYFRTTETYSLFKGAMFSSEEGLLKPDPQIFLLFLDKFRLHGADCVFVDDTKANIAGAESVGIKGVLFDAAALKNFVIEE